MSAEPSFPQQLKINRRMRLQWEEAQNCYVLLYPEGMVRLNGSAGEILKCCDGSASVAAIVATLETKFARTGLQADVEHLLAHAFEQNWITAA